MNADTVGCRGNTILLHSGKFFDFVRPTPDMIEIEDIAWGLAHTCRFGGHVNGFYSVAQHSILVAAKVPCVRMLEAILHDATEAYLGDIVKPLKNLLPEYQLLETRLWKVIADKFGLPHQMTPVVKATDRRALSTEHRDLTKMSDQSEPLPGLQDYPPFKRKITPWPPEHAYKSYLYAYNHIINMKDKGKHADQPT